MGMESDDRNVYIKRGRRYIPFGMRVMNYLPDGIWYIRHYDNSYGTTNIDHYLSGLYKVGELPEAIDIPRLCSLHTYCEYVMSSPEFKELMDNHSYSFQELTSKIVALVVKLNDTIKKRQDDDRKRLKGLSTSL